MLDALRKQATGWVAQIFIGLLVLSFAVWGVSGFFTGIYADTVATVGKTDVSAINFARQYEQAMQSMTRQTGRPMTQQQAQLLGLPSQVLGRLVTQATLDDTAREFGLGVSNEVLARRIGEDPAFQGPDGNFSRLNFQQALRNVGYTEDQFVTDQHDVLLRYQLSNALVGGTNAPEPYLKALHEYRAEERAIDYIVLTAEVAGDVGEPSDTELTAYFDENSSRWRAPEYRSLSFFEVAPADIADPEVITDEQAQAAYDRDIEQYTKPERREVSQILFETENEATAAAQAMSDGKSFEEVVAERNLSASDTDLGFVSRSEIIDSNVAETAFALAPGTTSNAVAGDFGWAIVRVGGVQPGETTPFADVRDDIKDTLALDLAKRRITQTFNDVEDSRAAGETFQEIADKIGTSLETIAAVDRSGNDMDGNAISDLPAANDLLSEAFASDVGIENDAVRTAEGGYVWYEVTDITRERDRSLDEVRDKVIADWKQSRIEERLTEEAEKVRGRLEAGEALAEIAAEFGVPVRTAPNLTRSSQPPSYLDATAIDSTFDGPEGLVGITDGTGADGSKAVLVVTHVFVPPFDPAAPALAQVRQQIAVQISNDYLQQFIVEKQDELGVRVNQSTLESIVGQIR